MGRFMCILGDDQLLNAGLHIGNFSDIKDATLTVGPFNTAELYSLSYCHE